MASAWLNADIGERGATHPVDHALLDSLDLLNLACGGHAGDAESVACFRQEAEARGLQISAHLSYPDRENFGRLSMDLPMAELLQSLDEQRSLLPDVDTLKFHGALYNDAASDPALAAPLVQWLKARGFRRVLSLPGSALAQEAIRAGVELLEEAFVERRYHLDPGPRLLPRSHPQASLSELADAEAQARELILKGRLPLLDSARSMLPARFDSLCIHSDSPIALELARSCRSLLDLDPLRYVRPQGPGIWRVVSAARTGLQDLGIPPGGAQDQGAFCLANQALKRDPLAPMLELVQLQELEFRRDCWVFISGAARPGLPHRECFRGRAGERLQLRPPLYGFRTYLAFSDEEGLKAGQRPASPQSKWAPSDPIRVLPGPEFGLLPDSKRFFRQSWQVSSQLNDMGIPLSSPGYQPPENLLSLPSAPQCDGCIQLTATGPLILMRERPTVGGYPRILSVVASDVDRCAQICPGQSLRFQLLTS